MLNWRIRGQAAAVHFSISLGIAALAAWLVFGLWYPYPYREVSGGRELFFIVVAVDVALGPLITLAIFNLAKPRAELRRDLAVVGLLQLAGLSYGLWTVYEARPVHLAFEIDRFRVVHAVDVPRELLAKAPPEVLALPLWGPTLVAVRPFLSEQEGLETTFAAFQGVALGARPDLWRTYEAARPEVLKAARPVTQLKARFQARAAEIDSVAAAAAAGRTSDALLYVPLASRKSFWTVLLDPATAEPVAFMPLDSF